MDFARLRETAAFIVTFPMLLEEFAAMSFSDEVSYRQTLVEFVYCSGKCNNSCIAHITLNCYKSIARYKHDLIVGMAYSQY